MTNPMRLTLLLVTILMLAMAPTVEAAECSAECTGTCRPAGCCSNDCPEDPVAICVDGDCAEFGSRCYCCCYSGLPGRPGSEGTCQDKLCGGVQALPPEFFQISEPPMSTVRNTRVPFFTCSGEGSWLVLQAARNLDGELFVKVSGPEARARREEVEAWGRTNDLALALAPGSGLHLLSLQPPCQIAQRPEVEVLLSERQIANDPSFDGWFAVRVDLDSLGNLEEPRLLFSTAPERDAAITEFLMQKLEIRYPTEETYPVVVTFSLRVKQGRRGATQQSQYAPVE